MSLSPLEANEILTEDNYFLWEFNARMTLAPADMKALAVLAKLLSPTFQTMIREATSALEAWELLRTFFVQQNRHNRVSLRKQLHDFEMSNGDNIMTHLLKFDDLCLRLAAVDDPLKDDDKLVLLGSLSSDYDNMVKIIQSQKHISLLEAKEMLIRE
ncbi:TPA: hypothetical protein N0F65_009225 [Lagenidium giganteum]|uniref:Polyprotein n=1 Tax=Lagenidium giganteum TaxID=4803 RepID=A0AAV2YPS5_9STRA|nr:TPA: hypothetical protein N0F65_009225 [Lagenidium giganteum]